MKKVIYSALTGGYDRIEQPSIIANDFDYVLFTNDIPEQKIGVWRTRSIPYHNKNRIRVARWVKTHPHILLPEYEISLWHDANVRIDEHAYYEIINELIEKGVFIASMDHIERNCIYQEGLTILSLGIDKPCAVLREMYHIKHNGYPVNNGLIETNCMLRRHRLPLVQQFCDDWWRMIENYSLRDQLSCNYVAWKNQLNIQLILPSGSNSRNHHYLHCDNHCSQPNTKRAIWYTLHDKFLLYAGKHYQRFIQSETGTYEEYNSLLKFAIIRYFFYIIEIKYKYFTIVKSWGKGL